MGPNLIFMLSGRKEELICSFQKGSEPAFTEIFQTLFPAVCYYIFRIIDDMAVSEDIAEESFIKIWDRRERLINLKVLKSYLYATARNASFKWLKTKQRESQTGSALYILSEKNHQSILEDLVHAEVLREIYSTLDKLPSQCRKIMKMLYIEGKTVRKTAEELQLCIGTIKTQKAKGLAIVRKKIK